MKNAENKKNENDKPWYLLDGKDRDVIISVRVRLARNLENFPFPLKFRNDDATRVNAIVLDGFSKLENATDFSEIDYSSLSEESKTILAERGIIKHSYNKENGDFQPKTVLMAKNGKISCSINTEDHIHLWDFSSGLNFREAYRECSEIDVGLQKYIQFAANYDFGYLTTAFRNTGSGMKLSAHIHIPGIVMCNKLKEIVEYVNERNCVVAAAYPTISENSSAAGSIFQISNNNSLDGSEIDQIAEMESICRYIAEVERKVFYNFANERQIIAKNAVIRAFFIAKFSLLISLREAIDIVSDMIKGIRLNIVTGISINDLCALLYEVQNGHLTFLSRSTSFNFAKDIQNDERLKLDHLRAIIIQDAIKDLSIENIKNN